MGPKRETSVSFLLWFMSLLLSMLTVQATLYVTMWSALWLLPFWAEGNKVHSDCSPYLYQVKATTYSSSYVFSINI